MRERDLWTEANRRALYGWLAVRIDVLRRWSLLQHHLHRPMCQLRPDRAARDLLGHCGERSGPSRDLREQRSGHLRSNRGLRRGRRMREVCARNDLSGSLLHWRSVEHRRHLRRSRHLPSAGDTKLRPVSVCRRHLRGSLHGRRRLLARSRLCQRKLRPQIEWPGLHGCGSVRQWLLRRRRLLRRCLSGSLPKLRAVVGARHLPAEHGWGQRSSWGLHRSEGALLRHRRDL